MARDYWMWGAYWQFNEQSLYRVQAGPFATRDQAQHSAERVRERLMLVPMVVERR